MSDKVEIITIAQLAEIAQESAVSDPIDWDELNITEGAAYQMIASSVLEMIKGVPEDQRLVIALASITKLSVENFVLNLKLNGKN
jgi:hypothetical protein